MWCVVCVCVCPGAQWTSGAVSTHGMGNGGAVVANSLRRADESWAVEGVCDGARRHRVMGRQGREWEEALPCHCHARRPCCRVEGRCLSLLCTSVTGRCNCNARSNDAEEARLRRSSRSRPRLLPCPPPPANHTARDGERAQLQSRLTTVVRPSPHPRYLLRRTPPTCPSTAHARHTPTLCHPRPSRRGESSRPELRIFRCARPPPHRRSAPPNPRRAESSHNPPPSPS